MQEDTASHVDLESTILFRAVSQTLHLSAKHSYIIRMLCKQMHKRWKKIYESDINADCRLFVDTHIEWAKVQLTARVNCLTWVLDSDDDEYDDSIIFTE